VAELSESGSTPVCIYMRDKVCNVPLTPFFSSLFMGTKVLVCVCVQVSGEEALKKTTLKSLGLTGGNAIVR